MNMKYRKLSILLSVLIASAMLFAGCFGGLGSGGDSDKADSKTAEESKLTEEEVDEITSEDYDNGIMFDEEMEGYKVEVQKTPGAKFVGKWEATSGNSHYLLGNLDLKINADGTWKGNTAGNDLSGTWTEQDGGIYLKCNNPSINFGGMLVFTPEGTLLYSYYPLENSTEPVNIVLTKK